MNDDARLLLGRRLFAAAYDLLPLVGLWFLAGAAAVAVTGGALDPRRLAHKILVQALVLALWAAYFVVSWTRGGQTLGMRAWRLRVVCGDGGGVPWTLALLRFVAAVVSIAAFGVGFCGPCSTRADARCTTGSARRR